MNQFVSLSNYVQKIADQRRVYNLDKDLIIEVNPQQQTFLIEYQGKDIHFRFENNNALVKIQDPKNGDERKVVPVSEVPDYLKSLRLDFLVGFVLKKVPFLQTEE